jgi:uncharacterized protein
MAAERTLARILTGAGTRPEIPGSEVGPMAWLLRDGEVLAAAEVAADRRARRRGLLGRDGVTGALVIDPCRHVHTARMRFAIDVALCDGDGVVLRTCRLAPWRLAPLVWRARLVVEAEAGAFARWSLRVGDRLEVRPTRADAGADRDDVIDLRDRADAPRRERRP